MGGLKRLGYTRKRLMKNHVVRKYGRRKAGSWGRPKTKKMKRAASKAARKLVARFEISAS